MGLTEKLLDKAKKGKKLVGIRFDRLDSDKLHIGKVIAHNDGMLILNSYSRKGRYNGQVLIPFENIVTVEFDDTLLRRTQHWIEYQAQIFEANPAPPFFNKELENYEAVLKIAKEQNRLIDFTLDFGVGGFGYVVEIEETEFMMRVYNSFGDYEGINVYDIYDLEELRWDTPEIRAIELLIDKQLSRGNGR